MANLIVESDRAWQALEIVRYGLTEAERKILVLRRSIYVSQDINEGDLFTEENIRIVRPGDDAPPHLFEQLLGRKARLAYCSETPLSLDQLL